MTLTQHQQPMPWQRHRRHRRQGANSGAMKMKTMEVTKTTTTTAYQHDVNATLMANSTAKTTMMLSSTGRPCQHNEDEGDKEKQ